MSIDTPVRLQNSASAARIRSMTAAGSAPAKWGNRTCTGLFDQPGLCLYPVDHAPNGPFISGNWAAYVSVVAQLVSCKTLGKQSTLPLLREPCQGPLRIARKGSREGLHEAKNRSHKPAIAVAISAACARDKEVTASRRSIGCDEPMEQHRGRAAAVMAKLLSRC